MAPGSSTPRATHIEEEGVLIDNFRLVTKGRLDEEGIRRLLAEHPWPARNLIRILRISGSGRSQ